MTDTTEAKVLSKEAFLGLVTKQLNPKVEVTNTSGFVTDLGADSLDLVDLIMAMTDLYKVEISDEDAATIKTPDDAYAYFAEKGYTIVD